MSSLKFRLDASPEIGLGHLIRSLSLADMLSDQFEITFYLKGTSSSIRSRVVGAGFQVHNIESEPDFFSAIDANDIIVLDGYHFDPEYQNTVKSLCSKLVCIDDLHQAPFHSDIIINHAPGVSRNLYDVPTSTRFCLGPDYALLRPEFLNKQAVKEPEIPQMMICFGGSDFKNLTCQVLELMPEVKLKLIVIIGPAYIYLDKLNTVIQERQDLNIELKAGLDAMAMRRQMDRAKIHVVPASGILFESIAVGGTIISGYYTDNQMGIYEGFKKYEVFHDARDFSKEHFLEALGKAIVDEGSKMRAAQSSVMDLKSPERYLEVFSALQS
ncbi:UDP-2,4-diacetamido-2,4,6-trideoxy-beta-L-altropyranose hydrolase [Roseivirga sp.]|uniref:UDP-2,4-diacetamido-2,4, 6-trideoxy-beta-L-altropyranose hydrolase n=1 Tax=Roseivirga sp. TaxID=1964215 RepID=UPI003B8C8CCA